MSAMPPIAVLAGGLATRMRPLTEKVPKSMLEVAGEPFISHQLRLFRREGITRVVLCTGFLGEMVQEFVGNGAHYGLNVIYSPDGDRSLGTGGALRRALPLLGPQFLVTYGDSYLDIPFAPVVESLRASRQPALMTVLHNQGRWDTSNVEFADGRIIAYSKQHNDRMAHIDYGLSMLNAEIFNQTPDDLPFDLASLYTPLVVAGRMAGYEVANRFYEIGSMSGLEETSHYIQANPVAGA